MASNFVYAEAIPKRYLIQSGTIEYIVSGARRGKETVYFDRWGMREARYSKVSEGGYMPSNLLKLIKDGWLYTIDFDKRVANKVEDTSTKKIIETHPEVSVIDLRLYAIKNKGGQKIAIEEFRGKKCDGWLIKSTGTQLWLWRGVPIKIVENNKGVVTVYTAISVEEKSEIAEEKFKIPDNIYFMKEDISTIVFS